MALDRAVGADVVFIATRSLPIRLSSEGYLETIPGTVAEILSKNDTKAYVERKTKDYLKAGVAQVWILDPKKQTISIHSTGARPCVHGVSDTLSVEPFIPGC